jgi:chitinase
VVAYFTQWGIYGRNYHVKNMVTSGAARKITTINYAFGTIVNGECVMTTQAGVMDAFADYQKSYTTAESVDGQADQWNQPLRGNFNQLKKLKQQYPHLKLLISLGGWTWSGGFHEAAKTAASRQKVVASCLDIYIRGNLPVVDNAGGPGAAAGLFDGIDIDWEYPGDPGIGNPYGPEDTHNFTLLLQEFRQQLDAIDPNLLLTIATGAGIDKYSLLELAQIHPFLNYINIMTYDFHGAWEKITGFAAPLYTSPGAPYSHPVSTYAADSSVQGYRQAGVPAAKIVLGIPFYGRGWTGVGNANNGLWQPATGGAPGVWETGIDDYKVIKTLAYPVYRDEAAGAVWKYNGNIFWSYDDPTTIAAKMNYVKQQQLGGVMIWSLDGDTADGELVGAIHAGLALPPDPTGTPRVSLYLPLVVGAK